MRLAARFARLASTFLSEVRVRHRDVVVDGKSVLSLMELAAQCGAELDLEARGADAEQAVAALTDVFSPRPCEIADGVADRSV